MARETAYPNQFYTHVFNQIQLYNELTANEQAAQSGVTWYNALGDALKKYDKEETGAYIKRDPKKVVSFVSRIKTTMVNDIAARGNLNAETKKKVSESIRLPSRSATAVMLQAASQDEAYKGFADSILKSIQA